MAAGPGGAPISDGAGVVLTKMQPDRPNDLRLLGDRELVGPEAELVRHKGASVVVGVGPREIREPALQLAVLACGMDSSRIAQAPAP